MRRPLHMIAASAALGALLGCQQQEKSAPPAAKADASAAAPAADKTDDGEALATYAGNRLGVNRAAKEMERLPAPSPAYMQAPARKRPFVGNPILKQLLY